MATVTIEFEGHTLTGGCHFCGPYHESEGAWIEECEPANDDPAFRRDALQAVEEAAYEQFKSRNGSAPGDPNDDWMDYDDGYSSGPDYWRDPDSGEYRCG